MKGLRRLDTRLGLISMSRRSVPCRGTHSRPLLIRHAVQCDSLPEGLPDDVAEREGPWLEQLPTTLTHFRLIRVGPLRAACKRLGISDEGVRPDIERRLWEYAVQMRRSGQGSVGLLAPSDLESLRDGTGRGRPRGSTKLKAADPPATEDATSPSTSASQEGGKPGRKSLTQPRPSSPSDSSPPYLPAFDRPFSLELPPLPADHPPPPSALDDPRLMIDSGILRWGSNRIPGVDEVSRVMANRNEHGMQLFFLGTSASHPTQYRNVSSVAFRTKSSMWLFDCGEDTQRQIGKSAVKPSRIDRIFITHRHPDHIFGLPGMLCTISSTRQELGDAPEGSEIVRVYCPPGVAAYVNMALRVSHTFLSMPVVFYEFCEGPVSSEEMLPQMINRRAKLFLAKWPADQNNPNGFLDDERLVIDMDRYPNPPTVSYNGQPQRPPEGGFRDIFRDQRLGPVDPRVLPDGSKLRPLVPEGTPGYSVPPADPLSWTLRCGQEFSVTAAAITHKTPSFAYVIKESSRAGRIDAAKCKELGVTGRKIGDLKEGIAVRNVNDELVLPEQVCEPDVQGRKVAILGDTCDPTHVAGLVAGSNVLVHEATFDRSMANDARGKGHSTSQVAGEFARACGVNTLIVNHFSARYIDPKRPGVGVASTNRPMTESGQTTELLARGDGHAAVAPQEGATPLQPFHSLNSDSEASVSEDEDLTLAQEELHRITSQTSLTVEDLRREAQEAFGGPVLAAWDWCTVTLLRHDLPPPKFAPLHFTEPGIPRPSPNGHGGGRGAGGGGRFKGGRGGGGNGGRGRFGDRDKRRY